MVGSVTLGLLLCLLLSDPDDRVVEALKALVAAVEADDPGLSCNAEGMEEKREADHDERSSNVSLRSDIRGGIESTVGRGRWFSLLLRSELERGSCPACSWRFPSVPRVGDPTRPVEVPCGDPLVCGGETGGGVLMRFWGAGETGEYSAFSWGRGRKESSSVMGGGDPQGTTLSEYTGGGDISLTTRNVLRGGG